MKNVFYYETEIGVVGISDNGKAITGVFFSRPRADKNGTVHAAATDFSAAPDFYTARYPGAASGFGRAEARETSLKGETQLIGETPLTSEVPPIMNAPFIIETQLIKEASCQLHEYFSGKRKVFDIPLDIKGTPFQQAVWKALLEIPYGKTRTYKEIAERIGNPKACRAVGMANNKNPVAIIIPCHRVIGVNGRMVGYAGGIDIKKKLLDLEKRYLK